MFSINKVVVEPYKNKGKIESEISGGFATIKQKRNLVGLKVLMDSKVLLGESTIMKIEKGSVVYFNEEVLHSYEWAKRTYECPEIKEVFMLAEPGYIVMVK